MSDTLTLELTLEECAICKKYINVVRHELYYHIPTQKIVGGCCIDKVRKPHNEEDYFLIEE